MSIKVGEWADLTPEATLNNIINWIAPCPPFNASGLPAIAFPTGFDSRGLPVGIQLVGKPADEITLIALAAQLEAIQPFNNYQPIRYFLGFKILLIKLLLTKNENIFLDKYYG